MTILIVAFLGFTGVAAMVPGGLAQPGPAAPPAAAARDATCSSSRSATRSIAFLLGYRAAALRVRTLARRALVRGHLRARPIAIGAAALRAMEIPRLHGPGAADARLLPVGRVPRRASPARRRDVRWIWQTLLLAVLGVVVIAWNLLLRP